MHLTFGICWTIKNHKFVLKFADFLVAAVLEVKYKTVTVLFLLLKRTIWKFTADNKVVASFVFSRFLPLTQPFLSIVPPLTDRLIFIWIAPSRKFIIIFNYFLVCKRCSIDKICSLGTNLAFFMVQQSAMVRQLYKID